MSLLILPNEVIYMITSYLDLFSQIWLSRSCKILYNQVIYNDFYINQKTLFNKSLWKEDIISCIHWCKYNIFKENKWVVKWIINNVGTKIHYDHEFIKRIALEYTKHLDIVEWIDYFTYSHVNLFIYQAVLGYTLKRDNKSVKMILEYFSNFHHNKRWLESANFHGHCILGDEKVILSKEYIPINVRNLYDNYSIIENMIIISSCFRYNRKELLLKFVPYYFELNQEDIIRILYTIIEDYYAEEPLDAKQFISICNNIKEFINSSIHENLFWNICAYTLFSTASWKRIGEVYFPVPLNKTFLLEQNPFFLTNAPWYLLFLQIILKKEITLQHLLKLGQKYFTKREVNAWKELFKNCVDKNEYTWDSLIYNITIFRDVCIGQGIINNYYDLWLKELQKLKTISLMTTTTNDTIMSNNTIPTITTTTTTTTVDTTTTMMAISNNNTTFI